MRGEGAASNPAAHATLKTAASIRCLHRAVENSRVGTSRLLLSCGADPNMPNYRGDVPLHIACSTGAVALVHLLLSQGTPSQPRLPTR